MDKYYDDQRIGIGILVNVATSPPHKDMTSINLGKNINLVFWGVKQFEFWLNLYKKLSFMVYNKYH